MSRKSKSVVRKPDLAHRHTRLDLRVDPHTRRSIERAARLELCNVTEYCVTALVAAARRTIDQHETFMLSEKDRKLFFDVLMIPPPASERLARAFGASRRRVRV